MNAPACAPPAAIVHQGDALAVMRTLPDASVDLIASDPPYHRCKADQAWDRQWKTDAAYLAWMGELCVEWRRLLRPNGSLYVFASPRMVARVECVVAEHFNVLQQIIWNKAREYAPGDKRATAWKAVEHGALRQFFPHTERIIFAEHKRFTFEPLRAYLDDERIRAGVTKQRLKQRWFFYAGTKGEMPRHWIERIQWAFPTADTYRWYREALNELADGGEYLRREYEDLRREYEDLRRPFAVTADVPYTDVWDFPTVPAGRGKHVCEKPEELFAHIVRASSRPGGVVLDSFLGSGACGAAAVSLGRSFVGIELDARWCERARLRIGAAREGAPVTLPVARPGRVERRRPSPAPLPLFEGLAA